MEDEIIKIKSLSYDELIDAESKVSKFLKKIESDYKDTKEKGGQ